MFIYYVFNRTENFFHMLASLLRKVKERLVSIPCCSFLLKMLHNFHRKILWNLKLPPPSWITTIIWNNLEKDAPNRLTTWTHVDQDDVVIRNSINWGINKMLSRWNKIDFSFHKFSIPLNVPHMKILIHLNWRKAVKVENDSARKCWWNEKIFFRFN